MSHLRLPRQADKLFMMHLFLAITLTPYYREELKVQQKSSEEKIGGSILNKYRSLMMCVWLEKFLLMPKIPFLIFPKVVFTEIKPKE